MNRFEQMDRMNEISRTQDRTDAQTMLALMEQRKAYPKSYKGVRDAVAQYRSEAALQLWAKRRYGHSI